MRIISKFKDYYDYLQGIYGVDEKITIDRTEFTPRSEFLSNGAIGISVCGFSYQGLVLNNEVYWGEDIAQFALPEGEGRLTKWMRRWRSRTDKEAEVWVCDVPDYMAKPKRVTIRKEAIPTDVNDKQGCPIVLGADGKYPILKDYNFQKQIHPEDLWVQLSNWMSRTKDLPDTQSNKDKILSAGFDLKTSFRKM